MSLSDQSTYDPSLIIQFHMPSLQSWPRPLGDQGGRGGWWLTIDSNSGRRAAATGHDVLGHTGVVGCVSQAGLAHHQAMLPGHIDVGIQGRVN